MPTSPSPIRQPCRALAASGLIFAWALIAGACVPEDEGRSPRPPAIQLSDVTLRHYASTNEEPPRIAHADKVIFNRETSEITAERITADVPPTLGLSRGGARLEVEAGAGDIHGERAEAFGPLTVTTGAGDRGQTIGSTWVAEDDLISGEHPLSVEGPGYSMEAKSYRFHVDEQRLQLEGGVHAISREQQEAQ